MTSAAEYDRRISDLDDKNTSLKEENNQLKLMEATNKIAHQQDLKDQFVIVYDQALE
jgi:hypothetical protein